MSMFTFVLIILLSATTVIDGRSRIASSEKAGNGKYPYIALVSIRSTGNKTDFFTGTIVGERWVLSSFTSEPEAHDIEIYYGERSYERQFMDDYHSTTVLKIERKKIDDLEISDDEYDVVLMKTDPEINLEVKNVGVAKLMSSSPYGIVTGFVVGFGCDNCEETKELHYAPIVCSYRCEIIPDNFTSDKYGNKFYTCPRGDGVARLVDGDYGGPLLLSTGEDDFAVCAVAHDTRTMPYAPFGNIMIYKRLQFYLEWIKETAKDDVRFIDKS